MGTRTRHIVTAAAVGSLLAVAGITAAVDDGSTAVRTTSARLQHGSADAFEQRALPVTPTSGPDSTCGADDFAGSADAFSQRCTEPASTHRGSPDAVEHRLASDG
jgi:hypothetical protein